MKGIHIKVGGFYFAKISGRIVTVRVDAIRESFLVIYKSGRNVYDVTNMLTKRTTTFRSASKFRGIAPDPNTTNLPINPPHQEYYTWEDVRTHWNVRCKRCSEAFIHPKKDVSVASSLTLLNHAHSHDETFVTEEEKVAQSS